MGGRALKNDIYYRLDNGQQKTTEESAGEAGTHYPAANAAAGSGDARSGLHFWGFPCGRGNIQPWRRRLWELQNNMDHE